MACQHLPAITMTATPAVGGFLSAYILHMKAKTSDKETGCKTMEYLTPAAFIVAPHIGGIAGGLITKNNIKNWYDKDVVKPTWRPPNVVFGPVWTCLYTGMGYASYLIWRDGGGFKGDAAMPLALYGTQLALNWAWTPIFFGAHKLGLAGLEITATTAAVIGCATVFYPINKTASYLMFPYIGWLSFASALTWWIYRNNKPGGGAIVTEITEEKKEEKKE